MMHQHKNKKKKNNLPQSRLDAGHRKISGMV